MNLLMEDNIKISLSKTKIGLLFLGAIGFVILGMLFFKNPEQWISLKSKSPEIIRLVGLVSIIFFGLCGFFLGRKLFDKQAGLVIDNNGITDNTNGTSIGLIEWNDIIGVKRVEISSAKILVILINNPDKYIERAKNGLLKRAMKSNNKMYGSPISIISSSLKMKFNDLESLIISEMEKRKK